MNALAAGHVVLDRGDAQWRRTGRLPTHVTVPAVAFDALRRSGIHPEVQPGGLDFHLSPCPEAPNGLYLTVSADDS